MDGKKYGLFEETEGENNVLNFTAPLLVECSYIVNRRTLHDVLDTVSFETSSPEQDAVPYINPDFRSYLQRCLENPKRLTYYCRDALRKHFKGRRIH